VQQVALVSYQSQVISVCLRAGSVVSLHYDGDAPEVLFDLPFGGTKDKIGAVVKGDLLHLVWGAGSSVYHARWDLLVRAVEKAPVAEFVGGSPALAIGQNENKLLCHYVSATNTHEARTSLDDGDNWETPVVLEAEESVINVDVNISELADTEATWTNTHQALPSANGLQVYADADQPASASPFEPTDLGLQAMGDAHIEGVNGTNPSYMASGGPNGLGAWDVPRGGNTYSWNTGAGSLIAADQYSVAAIVKLREEHVNNRFRMFDTDEGGGGPLWTGGYLDQLDDIGNISFAFQSGVGPVNTGVIKSDLSKWYAILWQLDGGSDRIHVVNLTDAPDTILSGTAGAYRTQALGTDINIGGGAGFTSTGLRWHVFMAWDTVVDPAAFFPWAKTKADF